jgi:hypothetical protein
MMQIARFMVLTTNHAQLWKRRGPSIEEIEEEVPEEQIDWHALLNEDVDIDPEIGKESSSESDWGELSEDEDRHFLSNEAVVTLHTSHVVTEDDTENSSGKN